MERLQNSAIFKQKEILKILGLKKQRFEYLISKLQLHPISPEETGTGKANDYDYSVILECSIGHILNIWGFQFSRILKILDDLRKRYKTFFSYTDYTEWDVFKIPEKSLVLYSKILTNGRDGLEKIENTYYQSYKIGKYEDVFHPYTGADSDSDKMRNFLNEKGFLTLDLYKMRNYIDKRIYNLNK